MRAIQKFLPNPRHTEIYRIFVNAKPGVAWSAARHFDMSDIFWIRLLFDIRTLPNVLAEQSGSSMKHGLGIDEITKFDTALLYSKRIGVGR